MLFREDFVPSERTMGQQQWTVTRRLVGHPGAQRRWDRAYQLLLSAAAPHPGPAGGGAPTSAPEESRHASSRLRPGIDPAPSGPAPGEWRGEIRTSRGRTHADPFHVGARLGRGAVAE